MQFSRFMKSSAFADELKALQAFHEFVEKGLLESLEETKLLIPTIRFRLPDTVARRFWLETHEHWKRTLRDPIEPDGLRLTAAKDLYNELSRWQLPHIYGSIPHPFDDPPARFRQFLSAPKDLEFQSWSSMRVDLTNDAGEALFDDVNFENYYSSWQLLLAAEVAEAGFHIRMNIESLTPSEIQTCLENAQLPGARPYLNLKPLHASRDFSKHESVLNAVVWFAEERWRSLLIILRDQYGARFRLSDDEAHRYRQAGNDLAKAAFKRFDVDYPKLVETIRFLAERWTEQDRRGRPLIANAYRDFLEKAVTLAMRESKHSFDDVVDHVGRQPDHNLNTIWPDWAAEEGERVRITLKAYASAVEMNDFVRFIANNGLEAIFWRLRSFEEHAFRGNDFALQGMKSDIQGMAVAVEHLATALGATELQLYEKFKQLWRGTDIEALLKRGDVSALARKPAKAQDWPDLTERINALRKEDGGEIAADLVMAYRIRGGVHNILPEDDQFVLEGLLITLMKAALRTFIHIRRGNPTDTTPSS